MSILRRFALPSWVLGTVKKLVGKIALGYDRHAGHGRDTFARTRSPQTIALDDRHPGLGLQLRFGTIARRGVIQHDNLGPDHRAVTEGGNLASQCAGQSGRYDRGPTNLAVRDGRKLDPIGCSR